MTFVLFHSSSASTSTYVVSQVTSLLEPRIKNEEIRLRFSFWLLFQLIQSHQTRLHALHENVHGKQTSSGFKSLSEQTSQQWRAPSGLSGYVAINAPCSRRTFLYASPETYAHLPLDIWLLQHQAECTSADRMNIDLEGSTFILKSFFLLSTQARWCNSSVEFINSLYLMGINKNINNSLSVLVSGKQREYHSDVWLFEFNSKLILETK